MEGGERKVSALSRAASPNAPPNDPEVVWENSGQACNGRDRWVAPRREATNRLTMNNRNRRVVTWLIVGILASGVSFAVVKMRGSSVTRYPRIEFGDAGSGVGRLPLVQGATPQGMPSEVRVYKVHPLASKKDALVRILQALPIASSPETDAALRRLEGARGSSAGKEESVSASVGGWCVKVWNGGQFTIYNNELLNCSYDFENPPATPTPEEARKAADDFLASIGPLPTDVHFVTVVPGDWYDSGSSDKPDDVVVTRLLVCYSAAMDGIPLQGTPLGVRVGPGPVVTSVNSRLRQVIPDQKLPVLSPQEAFDKLCAGECYISEGSPKGEVTSIKLVYWLGYTAQDLSYIMPVYAFEGEAVVGEKTRPWRAYVEAVRPEFLETTPADE